MPQNSHKFRVLWHGRKELTEVPGRYENAVPVPRVLWHGRTELTEVPGTGIKAINNLQKSFIGQYPPGMVLYVPYRNIIE